MYPEHSPRTDGQLSSPLATPPAVLLPLTITVAIAKRITGLGETTLWRLIKDEKLEVTRIGRRTLILYRSLEQLLASSSNAGPSKHVPRRWRKRIAEDHCSVQQ